MRKYFIAVVFLLVLTQEVSEAVDLNGMVIIKEAVEVSKKYNACTSIEDDKKRAKEEQQKLRDIELNRKKEEQQSLDEEERKLKYQEQKLKEASQKIKDNETQRLRENEIQKSIRYNI